MLIENNEFLNTNGRFVSSVLDIGFYTNKEGFMQNHKFIEKQDQSYKRQVYFITQIE